jgi:hypothetical protein
MPVYRGAHALIINNDSNFGVLSQLIGKLLSDMRKIYDCK